jgi:hypothetical protein
MFKKRRSAPTVVLCSWTFFLGIFAAPTADAVVDKAAFLRSRQSGRAASLARAGSNIIAVQSDFITAAMSDDGRFTIGTVAGDPSRSTDDNQALLFGHPLPGTSDTMLKIDGVETPLNSATSSGAAAAGDSVAVTLTAGTIQVLERLTIKNSIATGNKDTVEIYFQVTNTDSVSHTVGLRTQLDTLLGTNDGAPFRIPGVGEVTHDKEFVGAIPPQALVLDNLVSPNIISLLTFQGTGLSQPDRVVFGYWPVAVNSYDYTVDPNRSFLDNNNDGVITGFSPDSDSSVIVYWGYPSAFTLAAGQSKEMGFLYGIGNCNLSSGHPFTVLLCAPSSDLGQAQGASYQYAPVTISGFISNTSGSPISGAIATLHTTPDFSFASGYQAAHAVEDSPGSNILSAGQTSQIDWVISSNGRNMGRRYITATVDGENSHSTVVRSLQTASIPNLLYGQATDSAGNPLVGANVTALLGASPVGSAVTQADGTYAIAGLAPGRYTVRISRAGEPDSDMQAIVSDSQSGGTSGNPSGFAPGSSLQSYSYPNPVRDGSAHITFYTADAQNVEVKIFTSTGELIRTLPFDSPGAGWHSVDWAISGVANGVYFYLVKAGSSKATGKIAVLKRSGL